MFSFELCNAFIIIDDRLGFEKFTTVEAKNGIDENASFATHFQRHKIDLTQNGTQW